MQKDKAATRIIVNFRYRRNLFREWSAGSRPSMAERSHGAAQNKKKYVLVG